jgi:hypothetical protein
MTQVYVFGSGECEQLGKHSLSLMRIGLGDDQPFEIKKPKKNSLF